MKEIFIVEDDRDIRELLEFLLQSQSYKVTAFPTAESFNRQISLETPDLIILDVMLPDGNGVSICRSLKEIPEKANIPVVLMSAHANASNLHDACAKDFIAKPFDVDDFIARIRKQLN